MALKVGLEIHTQLKTSFKLMSLSTNPSIITNQQGITKPNKMTALFDLGIPGSMPKVNPECIYLALKLGKFLECEIPAVSGFDRKHYFYGDQPLGYQLTQHFNPIAKNGHFKMLKRHYERLNEDLNISIQQLQLEQDTGRSIYKSINKNISLIDFNRGNIPLVEMVTGPDFKNVDQVRAFLQVFIKSIKDLNISTGDLESGSIRVDVNVSVDNYKRVEIKNLPTISSIVNAIRFEQKRQENLIKINKFGNSIETRGWNGKETIHLRFKESQIDYRYIKDMELPLIKLNVNDLIPKINLPISYGDKIDQIINEYNLNLRDVKILLNNDGNDNNDNDSSLLKFYQNCYKLANKKSKSSVINWVVHELIGSLKKSSLKFKLNETIKPKIFVSLIESIIDNKISKSNGKLLLLHLINNKNDQERDILNLANEFNLISIDLSKNDLELIVLNVISNNKIIINQILNGKEGKINYLIGQCMKQSNGSVKPDKFKLIIKSYLEKKQ